MDLRMKTWLIENSENLEMFMLFVFSWQLGTPGGNRKKPSNNKEIASAVGWMPVSLAPSGVESRVH